MPRGFKRDAAMTKLLRANGFLLDSRSFISLGIEPHLVLKGDDIICQRQRVWHRAKGKCAICKDSLAVLDYGDFEMDHIQGGTVGRCDCLHNLQAVHVACHKKKHVRPQFTQRKAEAVKAFDQLYPESV